MRRSTRDAHVPVTGRTSRASSIVSTRTRISINTLQEDARSARSVDLVLGGRSFHISRDGSRVTSVDDELPPYSPPISEVAIAPNVNSNDSELSSPTTPTGQSFELAGNGRSEESQVYAVSPFSRGHHSALPIARSYDMPTMSGSTISEPSILTTGDRRSISLGREGEDINMAWRSNSIDMSHEALRAPPAKRRSLSHGNLREYLQATPMNTIRRKTGVQLPRIFTTLSGGRFSTSSPSLSEQGEEIPMSTQFRGTGSAGPHSGTRLASEGSSSPIFGMHVLTGRIPRSVIPSAGNTASSRRAPGRSLHTKFTGNNNSDGSSVTLASPVQIEENHAGAEPPPMDTENDISIHYTRLIRSIDRDHRRALHERDKELAAMRERLNEVDQVYRQQLRARDFTIEDLRQRLTALQEGVETRIHRAQHEVEDMWEKRWKDRDRHLIERMRRMELDSQRNIEQAIAQRDEEWRATWEQRNEQLSKQLQAVQEVAKQGPVLP
ncbi:conserved hypothetical protein [Paecilomyces variotii No. 5]|uniref:Uncharacterized protein n=1 Tax=Byssochlamys spectabilis (strain No. 5 / NBRC 109023) TaxID=1356009 RepID=V5FC47_BYSSN|nr:conserved hypothetical protein [Paecilomyces variotii No. 5]